jgi:hypothetical protein
VFSPTEAAAPRIAAGNIRRPSLQGAKARHELCFAPGPVPRRNASTGDLDAAVE